MKSLVSLVSVWDIAEDARITMRTDSSSFVSSSLTDLGCTSRAPRELSNTTEVGYESVNPQSYD